MKQDSPSVRIFCVDHREAEVPLPPGVTVIGVGKNRRTGILHDNEGANIAHLNAHLNEATALWWVWRHPEARPTDYVGFCHYRRFLFFRPMPDRLDTVASRLGRCRLRASLVGCVAHFPCGERDACRLLRRAPVDGILPCSWVFPDTEGLCARLVNTRCASERWIMRALELLKARHPASAPYFERAFREGRHLYACNMFVVTARRFEEMCATLLPVVVRLEEEWRQEEAQAVTPRESGFLVEFLVGTWWRWLETTGQARFLHAQSLDFVSGGYRLWYLPFCRLVYRLFPERLASLLAKAHLWLVLRGWMAKP